MVLLVLRRGVRAVLVELRAADRAAVVIFEPLCQASTIEGMVAWKLATLRSILALLQADVAVRVLAFLLLGKVCDEVIRAATRWRPVLARHLTEEAIDHREETVKASWMLHSLGVEHVLHLHEWVHLRGLLGSLLGHEEVIEESMVDIWLRPLLIMGLGTCKLIMTLLLLSRHLWHLHVHLLSSSWMLSLIASEMLTLMNGWPI